MVDDSSADRTLYRILLTEEYGASLDFQEAPDARRGLELCDPLPDCLLVDYNLPDMHGVEFLRRLGQRAVRSAESTHGFGSPRGSQPDLPRIAVVMLTGLGNEQVAAEAMRAGAQDYLIKDRVTSESLRLAIEKATGKIGLLKDLQAERDRLARLLAEMEELLAEKDALLEESPPSREKQSTGRREPAAAAGGNLRGRAFDRRTPRKPKPRGIHGADS
jgi:CheY-like chemotaxis protein